jgi:beta-glucan synthesis-associated protein KRE6
VYFTSPYYGHNGWNSVNTNSTGQIPNIGNFGLIDQDTPAEMYNIPSYKDGREMVLVFSDEFNTDGRTFYPGDDPYWEAVDLHYWVPPTVFSTLPFVEWSLFAGDQ